MTFFLFVTGGVLSSLGKGLTVASIGALLEARGLKVGFLKFDPYLNIDPGTMNPFEHGEVFVTDDGAETDLDLGHYHRFTHAKLSKLSNATSGQIYDAVIRRERKGQYLGKTVQVIPHVTDAIKERITQAASAEHPDVLIVEIGGTVGDIESLPFLEAIRQFRTSHPRHVLNIHLTYVPYIKAAGELKSKPTQHSVQTLRAIGIIPDLIVCRSEKPIPDSVKEKISLFCSLPKEAVFHAYDVAKTIYELPIQLHEQGLDSYLCNLSGLDGKYPIDLAPWKKMLEKLYHPTKLVHIAIVGKYLQHQDAYKSLFEALGHAATSLGKAVKIHSIDAEQLHNSHEAASLLSSMDGVLVPGGFGERGTEGMILAARYCRENKKPYLGICFGMQLMCIEFVRHVLSRDKANSTEIDPYTPDPVIAILEGQNLLNLGGTMRLGAYACKITAGSLAEKIYGKGPISERHRHRYEFNPIYLPLLEKSELKVTGLSDPAGLVEIVEIENHPWMVGVQFHPEFLSKPLNPHPLFVAFMEAASQFGSPKTGSH